MIDKTDKRDKRDRKRKKSREYPVHGKSLVHILNAIRNRAKK